MANTPFIQFPCGEWAPGYGPDDEPCDPLIPGDCDDDDDRHPCEGKRCGPGCPDCCVPDKRGKGCDDDDDDDDDDGGEGDEIYIELCSCDAKGRACIKYVGSELVSKWVELVEEAGCNIVILDRDSPEGQSGGGCVDETVFIGPDSTPHSCTTCPCWIVSEPIRGSVDCSTPVNNDSSSITENIINNLHCAEEIAIECFVCDDECETECDPSFTGPDPDQCPGCKPFEGEEPPIGDCICEIATMAQGGMIDGYMDIECEYAGDKPLDCWGGEYPAAHGKVFCEFCECKATFTWEQRCVEEDTAQHGDDGGEGEAELWANVELAKEVCKSSECYDHFKSPAGMVVKCFDCDGDDPNVGGIGNLCEWVEPVGAEGCDCGDAGDPANNGGMGSCPDAVYECCWFETYCYRERSTTGGGDGGGVDKKCMYYHTEWIENLLIKDDQCVAPKGTGGNCCYVHNTGVCKDYDCRGDMYDIFAKFECMPENPFHIPPEQPKGYCGKWLAQDPYPCKCKNIGDDESKFVGKDYKDCKCKEGDGHVDPTGPCDDTAATGAGNSTGDSTGNGFGHRGGMQGGRQTSSSNLRVNEENANMLFSSNKSSAYQINLQVKARNTRNKKTYDGGFNFSIIENRMVDSISVRKDNSIRSIATEVTEQSYRAVYNTGSKTPREQRTHGSFNIYDDKLNLFNIPRRGGFTPTPNSKWLTIFSEFVHKGVQVVLDALESSNTWDEFYVNDLSLSHINKSLNPRSRAIASNLKKNNLYGLSNIDFLKAIRTHMLKNTLNQLDISFYENFVSIQAGQPRFVVDVVGGAENNNKKLAIQMAMAYARALDDTAGVGINAQLSKMYRTNHRDKNSRISVVACDDNYSILLNSRNQLPIVCSDGTTKGLTFGTVSSDGNNISIVATDCTTDIQVEKESGHLFRLNALLREKILALLEVGVSDYMESETNKGANIETDYSLNLDGNNPRQDYYFFKPNYDTTETTEYYNESPLLVHSSRTYTLETDKSVQNSIMENQLGAKTLYAGWDDLIFDHIESSKEIKYYWVDFTLRNFGLSDNSKMPIIATSEIPYIILIPTARSKNNPYNIYSELYINDRKVGRSIKFSLHISREKITSVTNSGQVLEITDDGT